MTPRIENHPTRVCVNSEKQHIEIPTKHWNNGDSNFQTSEDIMVTMSGITLQTIYKYVDHTQPTNNTLAR